MHRDAMFTGPEDRMHSVEAVDRRAATAQLALVAWRGRVVEVGAAGPLQEIAPGRGHVAQLLRGAGEDRAGEQGIARGDLRVIGEVAVGDERADTHAAILRFINLFERQMRYVDQP